MRFEEFGNDFVFEAELLFEPADSLLERSLGIGVFPLHGGGFVLEELGLPLVEQGWLDLMLIAQIGNADAIDQVPTQNGDFFVSRVVFAGHSHGTDSSRFVV